MAKLSFIKLDIEIMNDSKIKMIRKMPDGAKLFELWIGLLCLGMKSGRPGCVDIGDGLLFNVRMLSAELDIPETTIELGLKTFTDLRMIEQFEDATLFISNFEKHQELEKIEIKRINERDRKRKYRDKIKLLSHGTGQGQDGDGMKCPTVDIDIDKDKEEDKDKKPKKHEYGEYHHVLLSDKQYEELKDCVDDREKWIKAIDESIEEKGNIYNIKNFKMAAIKWYKREIKDKKPERQIETFEAAKF